LIQSYKQLSYKYLKGNLKRTFLTLLGIILSVALISTIGLFMEATQRTQIENHYKQNGGSFHAVIQPYDDKVFKKIKNNPNISGYGIMSPGEKNAVKDASVLIYYADHQAIKFLSYSLKKGSMPKNDNEIVLESWVLQHFNDKLDIGDSFKLNGKSYKLVGLLSNNADTQKQKTARALTYKAKFAAGEGALMLKLYENNDFENNINELKFIAGEKNINIDAQLISLINPSDDKSLKVIMSIVIGIVVVSTIVVIYNAFQISIVDRMKQFGMLRSIGATKKQIRQIVIREATLMAAIAIPIGLLLSLLAVAILSIVMESLGDQPLVFVLDWSILAISTLISLVAVYASSYYPAFFASKISPLLAISSRLSITKDSIKRGRNKELRKPRSFPLSLALKNVKRNPNRFTITIMSIIISCVLFITFTSLFNMLLQTQMDNTNSSDLQVIFDDDNRPDERLQLAESMKSLPNVSKIHKQYSQHPFLLEIPEGKQQSLSDKNGFSYDEGTYDGKSVTVMSTSFMAFDEQYWGQIGEMLQAGSMDTEAMNNSNGVILLAGEGEGDPFQHFKVGDTIRLQSSFSSLKGKQLPYGEGSIKTATIVAIIDGDAFGQRFSEGRAGFVITNVEVADKLLGTQQVPVTLGVDLSNKSQNLTTVSHIRKSIPGGETLDIIDNVDANKKQKEGNLFVQILVYGFLLVVSLIGSVNIINTITVSILTRRKELAALKSIGMSQKDLKKMIIYEGLIYGFFGSLLGIVYGSLLSYIIYIALSDTVDDIVWVFPYQASWISFVAAFVICYLSALVPLSKIRRENIIDVIREG